MKAEMSVKILFLKQNYGLYTSTREYIGGI